MYNSYDMGEKRNLQSSHRWKFKRFIFITQTAMHLKWEQMAPMMRFGSEHLLLSMKDSNTCKFLMINSRQEDLLLPLNTGTKYLSDP